MKEKRLSKSAGGSQKMEATLAPHQKEVSNFLRSNDISIVIGMAGCAKDFVQLYRAVDALLNKEIEGIVITKPIVEVGKSIGFLPGEANEKTAPYERSFYENLEKLVGKQTAASLKPKITFEHVGFVRGNTFKERNIVIISEIQNFTLHELITYVTRLPESSKLFMNGDPDQIDIKNSGIFDFLKIMDGLDGVGIMTLDPDVHQMRRKLIVDIMKRYKKFKDDKGKIRPDKDE
jgi:phosphate starvation-inducible PhoH-like protein